MDATRQILYVADFNNGCIRKVLLSSRPDMTVLTHASGLLAPYALSLDFSSGAVFFADWNGIGMVRLDGGLVMLYPASNVPSVPALDNVPITSVSYDWRRNKIFAAFPAENVVKEMSFSSTTSTPKLTVFAGTGEAGDTDGFRLEAKLTRPWGVVVDTFAAPREVYNPQMYILSRGGKRVAKILPDGSLFSVIGGSFLSDPTAFALSRDMGAVCILDSDSVKVAIVQGVVTEVLVPNYIPGQPVSISTGDMVRIRGTNLGLGNDIYNVTILGKQAIIRSQSSSSVNVTAPELEYSPGGDILIFSSGTGISFGHYGSGIGSAVPTTATPRPTSSPSPLPTPTQVPSSTSAETTAATAVPSGTPTVSPADWITESLTPGTPTPTDWITESLTPVTPTPTDWITESLTPVTATPTDWITESLTPVTATPTDWITESLTPVTPNPTDWITESLTPVTPSLTISPTGSLTPATPSPTNWPTQTPTATFSRRPTNRNSSVPFIYPGSASFEYYLPAFNAFIDTSVEGSDGVAISSVSWRQLNGTSPLSYGNGDTSGVRLCGMLPGTYEIQISATDANGLSASATYDIIVYEFKDWLVYYLAVGLSIAILVHICSALLSSVLGRKYGYELLLIFFVQFCSLTGALWLPFPSPWVTYFDGLSWSLLHVFPLGKSTSGDMPGHLFGDKHPMPLPDNVCPQDWLYLWFQHSIGFTIGLTAIVLVLSLVFWLASRCFCVEHAGRVHVSKGIHFILGALVLSASSHIFRIFSFLRQWLPERTHFEFIAVASFWTLALLLYLVAVLVDLRRAVHGSLAEQPAVTFTLTNYDKLGSRPQQFDVDPSPDEAWQGDRNTLQNNGWLLRKFCRPSYNHFVFIFGKRLVLGMVIGLVRWYGVVACIMIIVVEIGYLAYIMRRTTFLDPWLTVLDKGSSIVTVFLCILAASFRFLPYYGTVAAVVAYVMVGIATIWTIVLMLVLFLRHWFMPSWITQLENPGVRLL